MTYLVTRLPTRESVVTPVCKLLLYLSRTLFYFFFLAGTPVGNRFSELREESRAGLCDGYDCWSKSGKCVFRNAVVYPRTTGKVFKALHGFRDTRNIENNLAHRFFGTLKNSSIGNEIYIFVLFFPNEKFDELLFFEI